MLGEVLMEQTTPAAATPGAGEVEDRAVVAAHAALDNAIGAFSRGLEQAVGGKDKVAQFMTDIQPGPVMELISKVIGDVVAGIKSESVHRRRVDEGAAEWIKVLTSGAMSTLKARGQAVADAVEAVAVAEEAARTAKGESEPALTERPEFPIFRAAVQRSVEKGTVDQAAADKANDLIVKFAK